MSNQFPCEIIQDLLPSYVDELTSPVTTQAVEEHIESCHRCREVLELMRQPAQGEAETEQQFEVDFLKKTRTRVIKTVGITILCACLLVCALLAVRTYLISSTVNHEYVTFDLDVHKNQLDVTASPMDAKMAISSISMSEVQGVVDIEFKGVHKSIFHKDAVTQTLLASTPITEVRIDGQTIWCNGTRISPLVAAVFESRHPYVGSMPDNGKTVQALNIPAYLGSFTNELQTTNEPYGWNLILQHDFSKEAVTYREHLMRKYACVLMAVIDNLGEVTFTYEVDETPTSLTVSLEEVNAYLEMDVKEAGKSVLVLQDLIERLGLNHIITLDDEMESYVTEAYQNQMLYLSIENFSYIPLESIRISTVRDGEVISSQTMKASDGHSFDTGEIVEFQLMPQDYQLEQFDMGASVAFQCTVTDSKGKEYELPESVIETPTWNGINRLCLYNGENLDFILE